VIQGKHIATIAAVLGICALLGLIVARTQVDEAGDLVDGIFAIVSSLLLFGSWKYYRNSSLLSAIRDFCCHHLHPKSELNPLLYSVFLLLLAIIQLCFSLLEWN